MPYLLILVYRKYYNMKYLLSLACMVLPVVLMAQGLPSGAGPVNQIARVLVEPRPTLGMPVSQVIQLIIKNTNASPLTNTVDVIKEGDPTTPVKGIVTTMFATMDVLKQAVAKNCNLIIAHEPVFYNHADLTAQFQNDPVYLAKKKYIVDNKLVVWRFHDYIHRIQPDPILSGFAEKTGWQKYVLNENLSQYVIPETNLKGLAAILKKSYPKNALYIVGNPEMKLSKVRISPGASGSARHISYLQDPEVDVVIAGETQQWETYEYTRDAMQQGKNKAVIFLGHVASEEPGMDFVVGWLKTFIKDAPIYFIEAGPSYWSY